jgi:hypothetical protein
MPSGRKENDMKKVLIFVAGAIVGGLTTLVLASGVLTGVGAGAGVATAMPLGVCIVVEGAKARGLITEQQVKDVIKTGLVELGIADAVSESVSSSEDLKCDEIIAKFKAVQQTSSN